MNSLDFEVSHQLKRLPFNYLMKYYMLETTNPWLVIFFAVEKKP